MEYVSFTTLLFEMTRKCNLKCPHCMRGEPQNVTITKEIIDKALDNMGLILHLALTGGEPFLEPEMIVYLVDGVIRRGIPVQQFDCITNGTVVNKEIAKAFARMAAYIPTNWPSAKDKDAVAIIISVDFHDVSELEVLATQKFYQEQCGHAVKVITEKEDVNEKRNKAIEEYMGRHPDGAGLDWFKNALTESDGFLLYNGRAKNLPGPRTYKVDTPCHRIEYTKKDFDKFSVEFAACSFTVGANGVLCLEGANEFSTSDRYNMGNVLQTPVATMLCDWQWKWPLTCLEQETLYRTPFKAYLNDFTSEQRQDAKSGIDLFEQMSDRLIVQRQALHNAAPQMPFERIQKATWAQVEALRFFIIHNAKQTPKGLRLMENAQLEYKAICLAAAQGNIFALDQFPPCMIE